MSAEPDTFEVEVPGRVCLFGEHSDWAGSYRMTNSEVRPGACIVIGTDQTLKATACEHPNKLIITSTCDDGSVSGPWECSLDEKVELLREGVSLLQKNCVRVKFATLTETMDRNFWQKHRKEGVAYQIMIYYPVRGLELNNHTTTLPMKKGLSSSAAFCVLISRAFNHVYNLRMTVRAEMELAYLGEILTPSRCGRMDQCCAFGKTPTLMRFDGPLLRTTSLALPSSTIYMVVVDLAASKDTKEILACLNKAYPFPSNEVETGVQRLLGPINEDITARACRAIHDGKAEELGALMTEAQKHFDQLAMPACPQQLTSPVLHSVLTHPKIVPRIFGAKGVGSQGDGCAQMVARTLEDQQALCELLATEFKMRPFPLTIGGAPPIKTAVILCTEAPIALFPAILATPPSLFPVLDADGVLKPSVLLAVEAADTAGLESILIVVPDSAEAAFQRVFASKPPSPSVMASLSAVQQASARRLQLLSSKIRIIPQSPGAGGDGRALLGCKNAVRGQEGLVVMHGDRLFKAKSRTDQPVLTQLLETYDGTSIIGIQVQTEAELGPRSVSVHGKPAGATDPVTLAQQPAPTPHLRPGDVLRIDGLRSPSSAAGTVRRDSIEQAGLAEGSVLSVCGHSVLSAKIFEALEEEDAKSPQSPLELVAGLELLCRQQELLGKVVDGRGVDLSEPKSMDHAATLFRT